MKKKQKWFDSSIIREDESRTTENTKHFILNNGTRKALFSPQNINYFDQTEKVWKPIDNSLKTTDGGYLANLGKYTAKLSKKTENETVEISNGSDLISWEYLGINKNVFSSLGKAADKSNAKRKSKLNVKSDIKDNMNLSHASQAVYADAEGNIDLNYSIEGNGVKENIIIKEKSDNYHYYFLLRIAGFEMKTTEDGKIIEFYKSITDAENSENRTPEFIMPAPFMYDANGGRSDDVRYTIEKIEEGSYLFSIEANADWINAQERVFPVCIDPQLLRLGSSHISVTHDEYQWCDCSCCSDCTCDEPYWMHVGTPYYPYIYLSTNSSYKRTAKLHIKKTDIDLTRNRLISAKLVFQKYSGESYSNYATIKVGNTSYTHYNEVRFSVPITDVYNAASGDFDIEMQMVTSERYRLLSKTPTLQIEYQPICDDPIRKTFSVENGVSAEFDVLSGNATVTFDDIADPVLGVAVSHVYKPNDEITEYGQNFRLNLDEKLERNLPTTTGAQYTYTDSNGDMHTFKEHFYRIGTNGEKVYIISELSSITADAEGRLWLSGTEVFRELTTDRGLRASARLEDVVNNAEWVEQRIDEEKQAEEQVTSYENFFSNFVHVQRTQGTIDYVDYGGTLANPDNFEALINQISRDILLLTKEEAVTYQSLIAQYSSLDHSINVSYPLQDKLMRIEAEKIAMGRNGIEIKTNDDVRMKNLITLQSQGVESFDKFYTIFADDTEQIAQRSFYNQQLDELETQKICSREQYNIVWRQLMRYEEKSREYLSQIKIAYKTYCTSKNNLIKLRQQIPVAYLISDSTVKGFNSKGELVIVQDKYGKYVVVEREKYNDSEKTRVSAVYDQDGHTMSFAYNASNKLSEICNSLGERVAFEYDTSGNLTSIKRDNQPTLNLSYTTGAISKIESSNKTFAMLSYNHMGMLTKITRKNTASGIAHDSIGNPCTAVEMATMEVKYTPADTTLIYDGMKQEIYKINQSTEQVTAHYEVVNGKVTNAECYTYSDYLVTKTERADKSCLNRYAYEDFAAQIQVETVENVTYNSFKEPVVVANFKYAVPRTDCDCPIEQTKVEYTYNDNRKLIEKKTTHSYCDCCEAYDITVAVEKYFYNPASELVRKESYVEGEELKTGINIEEHVFNENGVEIQSFTYNSLDPSSKFYTENEVDENGKVLSSFDESGEHKTTFDYERDGVTVKTERLPNGSKFSYGRDKDGTVTAITHSTENGEENSTTQTRTLDVVTEVKSGNNTVRYEYDNKRRVKAVSLNGVDDYVTYTYSGEHTDAEKVTATMADGTTVTTTKNAHGNVTKSTVGNKTVTNTYDADQQLTKTVDSVSGETTIAYDDKGNVTSITTPDHSETFAYDDKNVLTSKTVDETNDHCFQQYLYHFRLASGCFNTFR